MSDLIDRQAIMKEFADFVRERKGKPMGEVCTDNRFELIEKFKKELIESTNIETSPEEMTVLDNILFRFWQMGWLDSIDRMLLVKESAKALMHSAGNSVSAKAFRNAGRFIQNAIDGEAPEFERIPSAQPEIVRCRDCKYGVDYYHEGDCYCSNPKWGLKYFGGSWEFYCADAERKEKRE